VDTAYTLLAGQRFQDVLAGLDTRSITSAAGVTTGSFFHHFPNRARFAGAVVERFQAAFAESVDLLIGDMDSLARSAESVDGIERPSAVRAVAQGDWERVSADASLADVQHLLWATRRNPISEDTAVTGADVLAGAYQHLLDVSVPVYRRAVAAMDREMLPPFTDTDLAVTFLALVEGLQTVHAVHPEVVRDELFADLVAGALVAFTRPRAELGAPVELPALEATLVRSRRREGEAHIWATIAEAAAPLFAERGVGDVKVTEIAAAAGVSASTVYHHFGRVSAVAAAGWIRHVPELEAIATAPLTGDEGPVLRMEQVLSRFVELGKEHRGALEGLVLETVAGARDPEDAEPRRLGEMVPLVELLRPHIRELRARGWLRRRIGSLNLARSIMQLVAFRTLAAPADPTERIIDDTYGVVLEGALTGGSGR